MMTRCPHCRRYEGEPHDWAQHPPNDQPVRHVRVRDLRALGDEVATLERTNATQAQRIIDLENELANLRARLP